jgi:hypothetical protein
VLNLFGYFLTDENRCSAPVIFVEKELQTIQKVQRTAIFNAAVDCCGAPHLKKSPKAQSLQIFHGSAAFLISRFPGSNIKSLANNLR